MARDLNVGMQCIKYMLFTTNFLFTMIGFLLLSIGSTIKLIYSDFDMFMESHYFSPANLTIAIGVIMFFVSIFGCVGAIKESTFLINLYGFFMAIVLILEISSAIAAYSMRNNIEYQIEHKMVNALNDYNNDVYARDTFDFMQDRLTCCGVKGYKDWAQFNYNNESEGIYCSKVESIPVCAPETCFNTDKTYIYANGCLDDLVYVVSECAVLLGSGAIAICFVQVLGIVFARMLANSVRNIKTQRLVEMENRREQLFNNLTSDLHVEPEKHCTDA